MENPFKFASLRVEISKENPEVWYRLYAGDALNLRDALDPGAVVLIRGRVRSYVRKGGYRPELEDPDPEAERDAFVRMEDMFTLDASRTSLVTREGWEVWRSVIRPATTDDEFGGAGVRAELFKALAALRAGLDSKTGSGIEQYHEAEERLSEVLGNPAWMRPGDTSGCLPEG